jgi:hypothetical protein
MLLKKHKFKASRFASYIYMVALGVHHQLVTHEQWLLCLKLKVGEQNKGT